MINVRSLLNCADSPIRLVDEEEPHSLLLLLCAVIIISLPTATVHLTICQYLVRNPTAGLARKVLCYLRMNRCNHIVLLKQ